MDPYLFRLTPWHSENIPPPSGITALMKVHLATLQRITSKRPSETTLSSGQAHKKHMLHSAQDHGIDPQLSLPDERKRQRAQDYEDQNQLEECRRKNVTAD